MLILFLFPQTLRDLLCASSIVLFLYNLNFLHFFASGWTSLHSPTCSRRSCCYNMSARDQSRANGLSHTEVPVKLNEKMYRTLSSTFLAQTGPLNNPLSHTSGTGCEWLWVYIFLAHVMLPSPIPESHFSWLPIWITHCQTIQQRSTVDKYNGNSLTEKLWQL